MIENRYIRIIMFITVLFLTGEGAFWAHTKLFDFLGLRGEMPDPQIDMVAIKNAADQNRMRFRDQDLRILIIGDSYVYGSGIDMNDRMGIIIRETLKSELKDKYENVYVLDLSAPGTNLINHKQRIRKYLESFKPDYVIHGFNLDDLGHILDDDSELEGKLGSTHKLLYSSKVLTHIRSLISRELHMLGSCVKGDLIWKVIQVYVPNSVHWKDGTAIMDKSIQLVQDAGSTYILSHVARASLIEHPEQIGPIRELIKDYATSKPNLIFIDEYDIFEDHKIKDVRLTKYDSHMNAHGHALKAQHYVQIILNREME